MKLCSKCGCAYAEDILFCPTCGEKSDSEAVEKQDFVSAAAIPVLQGHMLPDKLLGLILLPLLLLAVLVAGFIAPMFFDVQNLENIIRQTCIYVVFGTGMLISVRAKGPDLSLGSVAALVSVIIAANAQYGFLTEGILLAVISCLAIGAVNGALTVYLKIPSVFVTLGMMLLLRGITFSISQGQDLPIEYGSFKIGDNIIAMVIILLVMAGLLYLLFYKTKLGMPIKQKINTNTKTIDFFAYIIASLLFGLGGIILLSYLQTGIPSLGTGYEIDFLMVIFLCGGSVFFEKKSLLPWILVITCFIYTGITNVFGLLSFDAYTQTIIIAALFLVALVCDRTYKHYIVSGFRK